jgi:hypothetical protein
LISLPKKHLLGTLRHLLKEELHRVASKFLACSLLDLVLQITVELDHKLPINPPATEATDAALDRPFFGPVLLVRDVNLHVIEQHLQCVQKF